VQGKKQVEEKGSKGEDDKGRGGKGWERPDWGLSTLEERVFSK